MTQEQPTVMIDDGSGNPVDRRNLRTAAWGGLIGTALEQYDFVIYGTATAIVFNRIFFPSVEPAVGLSTSRRSAVARTGRPVNAIGAGRSASAGGNRNAPITATATDTAARTS